jgi:single-stranded-DNA-specific exonuclease
VVAMQLSQKFKRPTIFARLNDEGYIRGSARGLNESELSDFKSFLTDSNLFEYNLGHANAFGTSIKNSDLEKFHKYSNEKLKDIDFGENVYDINFERQANSKDLKNLILDLSRYDYLWGQQNNEPYIYIQNINIKKSDVQVMGKNLDTVKFEKNGIIYIKFHAKQLIEDLKQFNDMQIEVVGRANLNEWGGQEIPQLFIENYSIKNGEFEF